MVASIIFMFTLDWKKDEEHAEWDRRRSSQEQVGEIGDGDEGFIYLSSLLYHPYLGVPALHFYISYLLVYSIIACSDGRDFQWGGNWLSRGECPNPPMKPYHNTCLPMVCAGEAPDDKLKINELRWHVTLYFQGQQTWNPN